MKNKEYDKYSISPEIAKKVKDCINDCAELDASSFEVFKAFIIGAIAIAKTHYNDGDGCREAVKECVDDFLNEFEMRG